MNRDLKKLLAGLSVAGLLGAGGIAPPGAHAAGSGWGATPSAGSTEMNKPAAGSGWGATHSAGGTEMKKPAAGSGWGGNTGGAVSTDDKPAEQTDTKTDEQSGDTPQPKKKVKSGWSG